MVYDDNEETTNPAEPEIPAAEEPAEDLSDWANMAEAAPPSLSLIHI